MADQLSQTFAALADPTRRAILARLAEGEATVKELSQPFAMSGPAISKHLRVLEKAGLIARGRDAQWRPCRLEAAPLKEVAEWASDFRQFWDESYNRLDFYLTKMKASERRRVPAANKHVTTFTTPSDTDVVVTRVFNAPRRLVFEAHTSCTHMPNWMGPHGWTMSECRNDLRPGGEFRYTWTKPGGTGITITGVNKEVDPPKRIVSTESWGEPWPHSTNTMEFTEQDGQTTLVMTIRYQSKEARDMALGTGMKDGMVVGYERLDEYLATLE